MAVFSSKWYVLYVRHFGGVDLKKRKYPLSFFIMGIIMDLIRTWYILVLGLLVFLVRIFIPNVPSVIFPILLVIWVAHAIVNQLRVRHISLNDESLGKMFEDNGKTASENIIEGVSELIEKHRDSRED
jgi:MFS superfamily sulfate permease-like transporter